MRKSLGDKRKELTRDAIDEIARLFRDAVELDGSDARVKVLRNQDFGFARLTVERPMRRAWRVDEATTAALSPELSSAVALLLGKSWPDEKHARIAVSACGLETRQINAVLKSIAVYDAEADPIKAKKRGGYEADADLRDQEYIPLPDGYLPMGEAEQIDAVRAAAERHLVDEIHPYVPDAWIDHDKTKIGYEIPFTRQFYIYTPPRPVAEIRADIDNLERQIQHWMSGLAR
jgi:type I restriction enzyme M protein